jgi:hypothetical protein
MKTQISEQMIGTDATVDLAHEVIAQLTRMGYDVEYGTDQLGAHLRGEDDPILYVDWERAVQAAIEEME